MDCLDAIMTRRSVRAFTGEAVGDGELAKIVAAGMAAPSPHNSRSYYILSITDREKLRGLIPLCQWWKMLETCGAALVVCADTRKFGYFPEEFHLSGCNALQENMLLAAHALGYGGVWLGVCRESEFYADFVRQLNVPEYLAVTGMMAIGRPAAPCAPADRFDSGKWVREAFLSEQLK